MFLVETWGMGAQEQLTNIQTFKYTEQNNRVKIFPPSCNRFHFNWCDWQWEAVPPSFKCFLLVLSCSAVWPWFSCWSVQHCARLHSYWWPLHQRGAAPSLWLEGSLSQPLGLLQLPVPTRIYRTSVWPRYSSKTSFAWADFGFLYYRVE